MKFKRIIAVLLALTLLFSALFIQSSAAADDKTKRIVYLHALGENPTETENTGTVYMGDIANVYLAVDNPNKGSYDGVKHLEPQYDMNGYTAKIYFDPAFFDYAAADPAKPIDYTIPNNSLGADVDIVEGEEVPTNVGFYEYRHGSGTKDINGKIYKTAYITVFFSGTFLPQKSADTLWYNLCALPLKPLKTGSSDVFVEIGGVDDYTLELFAKDVSDEYAPNFEFSTINGGYHHIIIKDKLKPSSPVAEPSAGSYTETQLVTFTAEDDCDIFCSIGGEAPFKYTQPIEVERTTEISCYALRNSDGKVSNTVSYHYEIIPKAPYLFDEAKETLPNIYTDYKAFNIYASDKSVFGTIEDDSEIYYTFSAASGEDFTPGTNPETEWVKLEKRTQSITIDKKRVVRLITEKAGVFGEISWYYLGIKPAEVTSSQDSGEYGEKIDIELSTKTADAKILYTKDGSDPRTNGLEYLNPLTINRNTTLRAISVYDGEYSDISSFYYIFNIYDDLGVDAFYPSGVYDGGVPVTLMPQNPGYAIVYSTDGGQTWEDYTKPLQIENDTDILAKAVDGTGNEGGEYSFTYVIKPLPPAFAPASTQFTNADKITIFCTESMKSNTSHYKLLYTLDGTSPLTNGIQADDDSDTVTIDIKGYTVVSAVVLKDDTTYSSVATNSYDIVTKKPVRPITSLTPGYYVKKLGYSDDFETQFMPVPGGTEIYYTVSYGNGICADPVQGAAGTVKYDGTPIEIKGQTIIKAIAVNIFGVKSDIGIFGYTVTPETPKAAPSAVIYANSLPVVPVEAVSGCEVFYTLGDFDNSFTAPSDGIFYVDTATGGAYLDNERTKPIGSESTYTASSPTTFVIHAKLDGVVSETNRYTYGISSNSGTIAPPYADKATGTYDEINIDGENNLLFVSLFSLNNEADIQYMLDNSGVWNDYTVGNSIKLHNDTVVQLRSHKDGKYSSVVSYVYNFVPLAPIITLPSGRYSKTPTPTTTLTLDSRAPTDRNYSIFYRENGDTQDFRYTGVEREITHTMSFKAYVLDGDGVKRSASTIHYYIIEADNVATGGVYVAAPFDTERISAEFLDSAPYTEGIKLLTQNKDAHINYYYTYTKTDKTSVTTNQLVYDNAMPIFVNSLMDDISITAWLTDKDENSISDSESTFNIEFVHLGIPSTSLEKDGKVGLKRGTKYTLINEHSDDENITLYYTLDGSDPSDSTNTERKAYNGEELSLTEKALTVKTVYYSACGKCVACKGGDSTSCWNRIYGKTGIYKYVIQSTSSGGAPGISIDINPIDNTRKYTKDIFGNEHPTHVGYIKGYPDGTVSPEGNITREELAAILCRIKNREYEKPFVTTGNVFPDVSASRWSASDVEYLANDGVLKGYPDGTFLPENNLTRAEFAASICRFAKLERPSATDEENIFSDLDNSHWAYDDIMSLLSSGLIKGYEDATFRPEISITRAEVMTVINRLLGRMPSETYIKSLKVNPYNDLKASEWYYVDVIEATITHNYYLDDNGIEYKWESYNNE